MTEQARPDRKTRGFVSVHAGTIAVLAGALLLAIVPLVGSRYHVSVLTQILILSIFALSIGFLMGFPKLISLGHAAFFGVGAYAAGLVATRVDPNVVLTLGVALVLSLLLALVIGVLSLRSTGIYFLMITLAFAQLVFVASQQWVSLTGGTNGLVGITRGELFTLLRFDRTTFFYLVLLLAVLSYLLFRTLVRSPYGRILIGIGSNEQRMRAIGYNTHSYKLTSFVVAGAAAGLSGALWAHFNGIVTPEELHWSQSAEALIMVIVGGAGTLIGPMLGAALIWLLESVLKTYTEQSTMITGIVFIFFVFFARNGIAGAAQRAWEMVRR